jgi:DNA topoisomerase-1
VNAAIVMLIDKAYFRVGSEKYAKENETYGASSLLKEHVKIDGNTVTFTFTGKRNVDQQKILTDPQIASTIKELMKLPGDQLFQCTSGHPLKGKGDQLTPLNNNDVNSYLKDYGFTAKDFRTYHATRICDEYLRASGDPKTMAEAKKLVNTAVNKTAEELGHTPAVCRNNYINPTIPEYFMWKGVKAEAETKKAKGKELKKGQEAPKWVGVGLTDDEKEFNKRLETIKQEMAEMEVEKNEGKFVDPDTESQNEGEEG